MNDCVKICNHVRLSYKLIASAIYIGGNGEITITAENVQEGAKLPILSVPWLETMCKEYTFRERGQAFGISDLLAEEGLISYSDDIYGKIKEHLRSITIIMI